MRTSKYIVAILGITVPVLICVMAPGAAHADKTIESHVCAAFTAPVLSTPSSAASTDDISASLAGSGEAGMAVTIINNGISSAVTTIAADGSFQLDIPLQPGENRVLARSSSPCQQKDSDQIVLLRNVPAVPSGGTVQNTDAHTGATAGLTPQEPLSVPPDTAPAAGQQAFRVTAPADNSSTAVSSVSIRGAAPAGSNISVYVNGIGMAQVVADERGDFAVRVPLVRGKNEIRLHAVAPDGSGYNAVLHVTSTASDAAGRGAGGMSTSQKIAIAATSLTTVSAAAGATVMHVVHVRVLKPVKTPRRK